MSSRTEEKPTFQDWLAGGALLSAGLYLLSVYTEGQLGHTFRFFFELLVYLDRILAS